MGLIETKKMVGQCASREIIMEK